MSGPGGRVGIDQKAGAASPCWTKSILREDCTDSPARRQSQSVLAFSRKLLQSCSGESSGSHYITPPLYITMSPISSHVTVSQCHRVRGSGCVEHCKIGWGWGPPWTLKCLLTLGWKVKCNSLLQKNVKTKAAMWIQYRQNTKFIWQTEWRRYLIR